MYFQVGFGDCHLIDVLTEKVQQQNIYLLFSVHVGDIFNTF